MNKNDPTKLGIAGIFMATPEAIIASEYAGQRELQTASQLPKPSCDSEQYDLERWGIKFLGSVKGDELFVNVQLPKGWTIKPTTHSMYSDLLDENGYKRASIGYKAAFYDRWANLSICHCLNPGYGCDDWDTKQYYPVIKLSNGKVLWRGKINTDMDKCREEAQDVLTKAYPDWHGYNVYWDLKEFKFPKWESQEPEGQDYDLCVTLYHANGNFADSGGDTTKRYKTDAEALKGLEAVAKKSFGGRYKVEGAVRLGEKVIGSFKIELPRPKFSKVVKVYNTNGCSYERY